VLEGEAGQQLALGLYNEGDTPHTFTIDEAGIDEELPTGVDAISIDVTFPDSGALIFYCRFHRDQGMVGALSVDGSLETGSAPDGGDGVYG
jgi:plastocyanin